MRVGLRLRRGRRFAIVATITVGRGVGRNGDGSECEGRTAGLLARELSAVVCSRELTNASFGCAKVNLPQAC
jgi:hypothetical protein